MSRVKPIHFTRHARERLVERLASEEEVVRTIREASWQPAGKGRYRTKKWYPFGKIHGGAFFPGKDVEPVFLEEQDRIVVVTVYVYFNQRTGQP